MTPIYPLICPLCDAPPKRLDPLAVTYRCGTTWSERKGLSGTCYELHMGLLFPGWRKRA